jgi:preprotein translocase SecE subunit
VAKNDTKAKQRPTKPVKSLREMAETAANANPRRLQTTRHRLSAPFRFIAKPFKWLGKYKAFRFIGYIFVPPYFRNSFKELKLVTWPGKRQSIRLTYAVLGFSIVFGLAIAIVDYGLDKLSKQVLLK